MSNTSMGASDETGHGNRNGGLTRVTSGHSLVSEGSRSGASMRRIASVVRTTNFEDTALPWQCTL